MANETTSETPAELVSVTVEGRQYSGTFRTGRGFVMLKSDLGKSTAPRGTLPAAKVAEMLLRKLVSGRG